MNYFDEYTQGRRFSAIGIRHPGLASVDDFERCLGAHVGEVAQIEVDGIDGGELFEVNYYDSVHRYPQHFRQERSASGAGHGYAHLGFLAFTRALGDSTAWVISPYGRLLAKTVARLANDVILDSPSFVRPKIEGVIAASRGAGISIPARNTRRLCQVSRVSLRVHGDVAVQTVDLAGRAPLGSELLSTIQNTRVKFNAESRPLGVPFGLRFEIPVGERNLKLHIDDSGNFYWYLAEGNEVAGAVKFLNQLELLDLLAVVARSPRAAPNRRAKSGISAV